MYGLKSVGRILKGSILMLAFFVVSCIEVDDIGNYWGRATLDPRLEGRWLVHTEDSEGYIIFTRGEDSYVFTSGSLEDGRDIPDKSVSFIKSLEREGVDILLARDSLSKGKNAQIFPYKIVDGRMEVFHMKSKCWGANECTRDVLEMAAEIKARGEVGASAESPLSLEIAKLNDESLDALIYLFNHYPHWNTTIAEKTSK